MSRPEPTITGRAVLRFRAMLDELGVAATPILRAASLPTTDEIEDVRIPRANYLHAKALASEALNDPCLGFWFGARTGLEEIDVLGALVGHASTLREAIEVGSRYMGVWEEDTVVHVRSGRGPGRVQIAYQTAHPSARATAIDGQQSVLLLANTLRVLHPRAAREARVHCACPGPRHDRCLEAARSTGIPMTFDAPDWSLELPAHALDEPLAPKSAVTRRVLHDAVERSAAALREGQGITPQVRAALRSGLEHAWGIREVAAVLGSQPRTLQWQLRRAGTSFRDEVRAVRLEVARALLGQPSPAIAVVAERTGFYSAAAFTRFFVRETGVLPSAFRAAALDPPGSARTTPARRRGTAP